MQLTWKAIRDFWSPFFTERDAGHIRERQRRDERISTILDRIGFSFRVYLVAFLGFLASSWSLIAVTIVTPALDFIYNRYGQFNPKAGLVLDVVTLTATALGMVLFGHIADRVGRSALYGFEIIIVLAAVGGAAFASAGFIVYQGTTWKGSLDIYAALFSFRFFLGLGIGAEYPMSAVIAAEFSPTKWRGVMLSGVFLAQSIGRLLAYGIGLGALRGLSSGLDFSAKDANDEAKIIMDIFWRLELALAGIPAILAIGFRLFIPETPRFYSAVKRDIKKARESLTMIGSRTPELIADIERIMVSGPDDTHLASIDQQPWKQMAYDYYFGRAKGWKLLFAISIQWAMLDIVFYGVGMDNPGTLAALWLDKEPAGGGGAGVQPSWNDDPAFPSATIVRTIENNLVRTLELSSIAAIAGSLAVIPLVDRLSRKTHYIWTTWALSILFACMAISVSQTYASPNHTISMVLYALAQFMFNVGPNTLTFMLAAEIFPTEVRGTSYGIAAACGKIGAIIIRPVIGRAGKGRNGLVTVLAVFSVILAVMALLVWLEPFGIAFPRVQKPRPLRWKDAGGGGFVNKIVNSYLENESLEDIAPWPLADDQHTGGDGGGGGGGVVALGGGRGVTGPGRERRSESESESETEAGSSAAGEQEIEEVVAVNGSHGQGPKSMLPLDLPGPAIGSPLP